jgi:SAM-dependent methyltransferase
LKTFQAKEMMLGLGDTFDYQECADCGTLQIREPPAEMGRYYPPDRYYSFRQEEVSEVRGFKRFLRRQRNKHLAGSFTLVGSMIAVLKPRPRLAFLRTLNIKPHHRILDVGCGQGALLSNLAEIGYRNLLGVDPFIDQDIHAGGYIVRKATIKDLHPPFDLIMFHHSLEHVVDPVDTLTDTARLLAERGVCLVRVPTPSSDLYTTYAAQWVNLDAPRHFVIPSRRGLAIASERAGLRIVSSKDKTPAFSYWGSEQYRRGIALESSQSYARSPENSPFSAADIKHFSQMAKNANARERGDWIEVILTRS